MSDTATITITCPAPDRAALEQLVVAFAEAVGGSGRVAYVGSKAIRAPRPLADEEQAAADVGVVALKAALDTAATARAAKSQEAKAKAAAEEAAKAEREAAAAERRRIEAEANLERGRLAAEAAALPKPPE